MLSAPALTFPVPSRWTQSILTLVAAVLVVVWGSPGGAARSSRRCEAEFKPAVDAVGVEPSTAEAPNGAQKLTRGLPKEVLRKYGKFNGATVAFFHLPARKGKPTVFVFNGRLSPLGDINRFVTEFAKQRNGEGLVFMFYRTQFESLYHGFDGAPAEVASRVTLTDFVNDAEQIISASRITGEIIPLGYSYGAAPLFEFINQREQAQSSERPRIRRAILVSPLTAPGDGGPGGLIQEQAAIGLSIMMPFWGAVMVEQTRETTTRTIAAAGINQLVTEQDLGPFLNRELLIGMLTRQIRAADNFNLKTAKLPRGVALTAIVGENEVPAWRENQDIAFRTFDRSVDTPVRVIRVEGSGHPVIAVKPQEAAAFVLESMRSGRP